MDNVPVGVNGQGYASRSAAARPHEPAHKGKQNKNKMKLVSVIAASVLLLALLLGSWLFYRSSTAVAIDNSKYQAVFFTNGQVYFGKLETLNSSYMKLTKVFYLQAPAAPSSEGTQDPENPQETANKPATDIQLIKLGDEIHGPEDSMIISKDQILFFENLKTEGKVTDSIVKYLAEKR